MSKIKEAMRKIDIGNMTLGQGYEVVDQANAEYPILRDEDAIVDFVRKVGQWRKEYLEG